MVKFRSLHQIEHEYNFMPATADADVTNGDLGNVVGGVFTKATAGTAIVMQVEEGDDLYLDNYVIKAGTPLRVLNLANMVGEELEVYGNPLPETFAVGDTVGKLKITEIIGNKAGAVVQVEA